MGRSRGHQRADLLAASGQVLDRLRAGCHGADNRGRRRPHLAGARSGLEPGEVRYVPLLIEPGFLLAWSRMCKSETRTGRYLTRDSSWRPSTFRHRVECWVPGTLVTRAVPRHDGREMLRVMIYTEREPLQAQTLGDSFDPHHNSFGFLRFFLAALVLLVHSFPLGGFNRGRDPTTSWLNGQETLGGIAVGGFFVISGFLISRSLSSSSSLPKYLWRRCLRIFPGFWVCLLVTAFVFGPAVSLLDQGTVFGYLTAEPSPWDYVRQNFWLKVRQYDIGGVLADTPYGRSEASVFNGSLWTLIYEFKLYVGLGILGALGFVRRDRKLLQLLLAGIWLVQLAEVLSPGWPAQIINVFADLQLVRLTLMFLLGAMLFLYRDLVVMSRRGATLAAAALMVSVPLGIYPVVGTVALAYLWLWLAVRLPLRSFARHGDFSYGLYIYAFPVQQLCAVLGVNRLGLLPYFFLCLAVTLVLAMVSWFLVESPCLRLKSIQPLRHLHSRASLREKWTDAGTGVPICAPEPPGEPVANLGKPSAMALPPTDLDGCRKELTEDV